MGVKRRVNWISQQRVDVPDMRSLESAVSNDFDELIKSFVTGTSQGYLLRGFEISMAGAIGGAASGLQLIVDPGAVFHVSSSQSGTFYLVPVGTPTQQLNSATNNIIDGAFAPSAINYVGLEYERFIDDTTSSQVYIWNPTTNNETTKNAPRAQILRYRIKITTSTFAANVLPIATITTDSGNNVVSITDARWMLFRLGTGGAAPNPFYVYPWTAQPEGRTENPSTSSSNSINPFHGGDKMLMTLKDWMNAIMTSLQEIKGTVYWYSPSSAGSIDSLRTDLGNTITTGSGVISHSPDTAGLINWDEDIVLKVVGSRLEYRFLANPEPSTDITLAENEVAYVTLIRDIEVSPNLVFTNSSAIVSSVGSIAWTGPLQAGDWVKLGAETVSGFYQIQSIDSLSQVTLTIPFQGASTGASGAKAKYTFGSYSTSPTPSSTRDIYVADRALVPQGEDVFWFLLRADNGGVVPRVYVRFIGSELEMGETEEIDDGVPRQLLQYIGSPSESSSRPNYSSAINPGALPEITDYTFGDAASMTSNDYFFFQSSADAREYYVWVNKDGTGVDPAPMVGKTGVELAVTTGNTAIQVAALAQAAFASTFYPDFSAAVRPNPNDDTVRVTNTSAGTCTNAVNFNMNAPFAITIVQNGTGQGNFIVSDGDNLTKAIKKLDAAFGAILASLDSPSYDEPVDIVASGETPPTSLNGPVTVGTIIDLPPNTRMANITQYYTVGRGSLQVFLNGAYQRLGVDWAEVGTAGTASSQIQILLQLEVGDSLEFRISSGGASGGGGGGGVGPQGPPGPAGPAGADAIGGPVAISIKTGNYTAMTSDNVLLGDATGGAIIFTLPAAASAPGSVFFFKKIDPSGNVVTVKGNFSELIDGSNTFLLNTQYASVTVASDGTQFWVI
jgi:hypothetical protein